MRTRHAAAAALLALLALPALTGAAEVAMELPFSRRVALASPARSTLRFSLWKEASGGAAPVWSEEKRVRVSGGRVDTRLGSVTPLDAAPFGEQLWVQVERKVGGTYRTLGARTMLRVVPYALWSASVRDGGAVPLGTVIDWWRPDDTWPVPDGYAICDGTVLDDPASPLHGATLPDLRSRFTYGASDLATIGATTGWFNHSHTTNISHNHAAFASGSGGSHRHAWLQWWGGTALQFNTWDSGGGSVLATAWDNGMDSAGAGIYPLSIMDPGPNQTWHTDSSTTHTHTVDPPSLGDSFISSSAGSSVPPSVLLLKIMRVR